MFPHALKEDISISAHLNANALPLFIGMAKLVLLVMQGRYGQVLIMHANVKNR